MAAHDARISVGLPGHPKTKKLAKRLGAAGCWHLVCLFLWTAANRSDGSLAGMTGEDVELAADWSGGDGEFIAALKAIGFLDGTDGAYAIHDWADHNPWAAGAEARSEKARWAALCKQHGRREAARMMPDYAKRLDSDTSESASSTLDALPESASSTPLAESSCAPSPSPSPSPSPKPKEQARKAARRPPAVQFSTWLDSLPAGEDAIQPGDAVFRFAADVGIPDDLLALAWTWFERKYTGDRKAKRYSDWRQVFRNAVEGNWANLWRFTPAGECVLTTEGEALRRALEAEARRAAA